VIHALAPDAELLFANWEPSNPQRFIDAVRWAIHEGASIISCSIIMPTWSDSEGGGSVHAELSRLLGNGRHPGDVLFFACAGNTADRHWSGRFTNAGRGYHSWGEGIDNLIQPWGEDRVSVEMCCDSAADLELIVNDTATGREVQHCRLAPTAMIDRRAEHYTAVVRFDPASGHSYGVRVHCEDVSAASRFHLFVLGGGLRQIRPESSIAFPGDGAEVVTVGAVEADGRRAPYSSCGPNPSRVGKDGRRAKPDLVAVVPFASQFRPRPFAGTSAATPQAAGLAAVLWASQPAWTASTVRQKLLDSASDLGPPGYDCETGYGLIHLPPIR
jgi:subtilisin family serine protease